MGRNFNDNPLKSAQKRSKNVSPRDGVTPSQQRALVALVEARSIVATARTAGVGESSIRRWLREDERFKTKLRQLREEALSHASLRLRQGASRAVEMMLELIQSKDPIEVGRASLVRTAIDLAFRSGAYSDFAERVATLETTRRTRSTSPVAQASAAVVPRPAAVGRPVTPSHTALFQQLHHPGHPKNLTLRLTLGVGGPHCELPFDL